MTKNHRSAGSNHNGSPHRKQQASTPGSDAPVGSAAGPGTECGDDACRTELTEEYLTTHKQPVLEGEVRIHKEVESEIQHLAVDAAHDEVFVEHVPINREVAERQAPRREDDSIIMPVYEEQVVVTRRLVLKEEVRIRRVTATERKHLTEEVRRERPVVEEIGRSGVVHERTVQRRRAGD